ncbi:MAG: hypothetical protein JST16_13215 [Bdellovibrionales bacterium]|nr:hypothetical protein [Bdellovibrionales bacterium]
MRHLGIRLALVFSFAWSAAECRAKLPAWGQRKVASEGVAWSLVSASEREATLDSLGMTSLGMALRDKVNCAGRDGDLLIQIFGGPVAGYVPGYLDGNLLRSLGLETSSFKLYKAPADPTKFDDATSTKSLMKVLADIFAFAKSTQTAGCEQRMAQATMEASLGLKMSAVRLAALDSNVGSAFSSASRSTVIFTYRNDEEGAAYNVIIRFVLKSDAHYGVQPLPTGGFGGGYHAN